MSFYGDIKRVPASPWIFDRIYPSRKSMQDNMTTDNVHIGRYILINYRLKDITSNHTDLVDKWVEKSKAKTGATDQNYKNYIDSLTSISSNDLVLTETYWLNEQNDSVFKDVFDLTVWQKVFTQNAEKYILIGELRAGIPRLETETITPLVLYPNGTEEWRDPSLIPQSQLASEKGNADLLQTENVYKYYLPKMLELYVSDAATNEILGDWFTDPRERGIMEGETATTNFNADEYNHATWYNVANNGTIYTNDVLPSSKTAIKGKKLDMKLYSVGNAIRSIYDVLFGMPANFDPQHPKEPIAGVRQGWTDDIGTIFSDIYKQYGLVGVLQRINQHYTASQTDPNSEVFAPEDIRSYFVTHWGDASSDSSSFIENIPKVVGDSNATTSGDYFINLVESTLS